MIRELVLLLVLAGVAHADGDDPWAAGVPHDRQVQANALFAEANQLFAQQAHGPALEKYRAAIALWDHPLIRFNMAVTEIRLDHILDADDDLEKALRFGQAPFSPELYRQALDYRALVKKQIGVLDASCTQGDVRVVLDGKPWFTCPASQKTRVLAGQHTLVGERAGYMTSSRQLVILGGSAQAENIALVPIETAVKLEYPYPRLVPLGVGGGGAAVALAGLGVWFWGRSQMDQFQTDFANTCPTGCLANLSDHPELASERDAARLKGKIAVTMMVVGSAAAIGGVVMAVLDRPHRVLPNVEVAPTPGGAAAMYSRSF
ncbi:MAG: hypothetical protein ACM31C_28695 [Acidobacteriota bacterium]